MFPGRAKARSRVPVHGVHGGVWGLIFHVGPRQGFRESDVLLDKRTCDTARLGGQGVIRGLGVLKFVRTCDKALDDLRSRLHLLQCDGGGVGCLEAQQATQGALARKLRAQRHRPDLCASVG